MPCVGIVVGRFLIAQITLQSWRPALASADDLLNSSLQSVPGDLPFLTSGQKRWATGAEGEVRELAL